MNILFLCRENCKKSDAAYSYISKFKDWEITRIKESERGKAELPDNLFPVDYIFCFRYPKILTKKQIEGAMEGAVNFHPAPPRYRGSGAINHALYNEDETFGVTAHMINDSIDGGEIVGLREWGIDPSYNVELLLKVAEAELLELFKEVVTDLYYNDEKLFDRQYLYKIKDIRFSGYPHSISEIDELSNIDPNVNKKELERIIRATWQDNPEYNPHINLHGYKFVLKSENPK